jgi:hypothetical protein
MSSGAAVGNVPITEAYYRYMVMVEGDVDVGHSIGGLKLGGLQGRADANGLTANGTNEANTWWYARAISGSGRVELKRYDSTASHGLEQPASFSPAAYLYYDRWHSLEMYKKINSALGVADGIMRWWLDDVLLLERTNVDFYSSLGSVGVREINRVRGQIFHGGPNVSPDFQIHHREFGHCLAARRIGAAKLGSSASLPNWVPDPGKYIEL